MVYSIPNVHNVIHHNSGNYQLLFVYALRDIKKMKLDNV